MIDWFLISAASEKKSKDEMVAQDNQDYATLNMVQGEDIFAKESAAKGGSCCGEC